MKAKEFEAAKAPRHQVEKFFYWLHYSFLFRLSLLRMTRRGSIVRSSMKKAQHGAFIFGKFARLYDADFIFDVASPIKTSHYTRAKEASRIYNYTEGDSRLTQAMGYYHIDRVHERWQSFGLKGLAKAPIFVNVASTDRGPGYDNAHYARNEKFKRTNVYVFGAGDRYENAGLDPEVYYHEYGHGVLG